ncbi:MAG: hypothetical protein RR585_08650 [Coprobacillus sp.]
MFKKFFTREEDEEEVFETVDPVLEQRRKEKFSAPLIYSDEDEKEVVEEKKVSIPAPEKKTTINIDSNYRMSEIISPITGVKKSAKTEVKVAKPKMKKIKKDSDELIPIISPFFGPANSQEEVEEVKEKEVVKDMSVAENLRNIAQIVEEEQDQLKIIEERTGEFKLDFLNQEEDSFIDEIDDSMSLDELMNLYEKKFKD